MEYPFILNDPAHGTERSYNALQARHTMTRNPRLMPPADRTLMQARLRLTTSLRRAQANMQHWQPTQRSVSSTSTRVIPTW
jgi:hypothetical protein